MMTVTIGPSNRTIISHFEGPHQVSHMLFEMILKEASGKAIPPGRNTAYTVAASAHKQTPRGPRSQRGNGGPRIS